MPQRSHSRKTFLQHLEVVPHLHDSWCYVLLKYLVTHFGPFSLTNFSSLHQGSLLRQGPLQSLYNAVQRAFVNALYNLATGSFQITFPVLPPEASSQPLWFVLWRFQMPPWAFAQSAAHFLLLLSTYPDSTQTWRSRQTLLLSGSTPPPTTLSQPPEPVMLLSEPLAWQFADCHHIDHGSPIPGSRTAAGPRPVRNRQHSRRWAAGEPAKLHLPLPIARITAWTVIPLPSAVRGKTVCHETGPWCQKGWGPLI